jgi:hypothetical protein
METQTLPPVAVTDARFPIGTQFIPVRPISRVHTVTDILRTYNSVGELVDVRYVATHEFMGQLIEDRSVYDTTIARGLIAGVGSK